MMASNHWSRKKKKKRKEKKRKEKKRKEKKRKEKKRTEKSEIKNRGLARTYEHVTRKVFIFCFFKIFSSF